MFPVFFLPVLGVRRKESLVELALRLTRHFLQWTDSLDDSVALSFDRQAVPADVLNRNRW